MTSRALFKSVSGRTGFFPRSAARSGREPLEPVAVTGIEDGHAGLRESLSQAPVGRHDGRLEPPGGRDDGRVPAARDREAEVPFGQRPGRGGLGRRPGHEPIQLPEGGGKDAQCVSRTEPVDLPLERETRAHRQKEGVRIEENEPVRGAGGPSTASGR